MPYYFAFLILYFAEAAFVIKRTIAANGLAMKHGGFSARVLIRQDRKLEGRSQVSAE